VGATAAVGMLEHGGRGVNLPILGRAAFGVVATLTATAAMSAGFTAVGLYSPNLNASNLSMAVSASNNNAVSQMQQLRDCATAPGAQACLYALYSLPQCSLRLQLCRPKNCCDMKEYGGVTLCRWLTVSRGLTLGALVLQPRNLEWSACAVVTMCL
jgi:hypothetical protein